MRDSTNNHSGLMGWGLAFLIAVFFAILLHVLSEAFIWPQIIFLGLLVFGLGGVLLSTMLSDHGAEGVNGKDQAAKAEAPKKAPAKAKATAATSKAVTAPKPVKKTDVKLFSDRPDEVDDLKLISGVGPKMEKTVNKIGVYQFQQIASWKKADVDYVDSLLESFHGRIARDEWVKQAKVLAKGGETAFSAKKRKS